MTSLKNRVVRLTYADEFYMDILPAYSDRSLGGTCILVPDRKTLSLCPSNPVGFIQWFRSRCLLRVRRLLEKAKPVPSQQMVAVLCGRETLPKVHPALRVFDYDKANGGFVYQLTVNG